VLDVDERQTPYRIREEGPAVHRFGVRLQPDACFTAVVLEGSG